MKTSTRSMKMQSLMSNKSKTFVQIWYVWRRDLSILMLFHVDKKRCHHCRSRFIVIMTWYRCTSLRKASKRRRRNALSKITTFTPRNSLGWGEFLCWKLKSDWGEDFVSWDEFWDELSWVFVNYSQLQKDIKWEKKDFKQELCIVLIFVLILLSNLLSHYKRSNILFVVQMSLRDHTRQI